MTRKYYYDEHVAGYERLAREGKAVWSDLFEAADFEQFQNREFLERALTELAIPAGSAVLEYGCGTGPAACRLASLGFQVDAMDLVASAIELARRHADERGLAINFAVGDICTLADIEPVKTYAVVLDSFCLQSIVTDEDRAALFAAVRARLRHDGYYLISTAMFDPERTYEDEFTYDAETGICTESGRPHRRHLTAKALRDELENAGFAVLSQTGAHRGDVICGLAR